MREFPKNPKYVNVIQGEYDISASKEVVLTTILGSCVAVCMYDTKSHIGGLNHYLLPHDGTTRPQEKKYGAMAMELLINGLLRRGADRANLKAKVFGGANVTSNTNNIGARNIEFAFSFLESEGFQVETHSTGGNNALRIQFHGYSGAARAMRIPITHANAVEPSIAKPKPPIQSGEITLF